MSRVTVYVVRHRGKFVLRWRPPGQKWRQRTIGNRRRDAEQARAELQRRLDCDQRPASRIDLDWSEFWTAYIQRGLAGRAGSTIRHAWSAMAALSPGPPLREITAAWCDEALADLARRRRPATVESYGKRLRAALNWAHRLGYTDNKVTLSVPAAGATRTRALALEEFERLELAARQLFPPATAAAIDRALRGLWCSGLRLSELLDLSWDDRSRWHVVDLDHARRLPCLVCPRRQKNRRDEVIPCPPELALLLRETPQEARSGPIFAVPALGPVSQAGKKIAAAGRKAGVAIDSRRCASAHDLRHSFAMRWAEAGLAEAELAAILRHRSTETTRKYYLRVDAQRLGERLYWIDRRMRQWGNGNNQKLLS